MPLTSSDYSLLLYTSIKTGKNFVADITDLAQAWQRTTRLVGGYWLGSFDITEQPSVVQDIFYNHIGSHIEERSGGVATWEGMIYDMDVQDVAGAAELNVQVGGYVFTANWRFITTATADGATGNISVWINNIVANHCTDYLSIGRVTENTLQYKRSLSNDMRAWDAILKAVELGDASGNPWRAFVDTGRRFFYEPVSTTPLYYLKGGARRRRSFENMANYVFGGYIDDSGVGQAIAAASQAQSISTYGQKEEALYLDGVPAATATAYRDTYLKEHAWPRVRTIGGSDVKLYGMSGDLQQVTPWQVQPGVMRDLTYPISGSDPGSFLTDARDFVAEEVTCGANSGLSLSTHEFEESEVLAAHSEYEKMLERKSKGSGGRDTSWMSATWHRFRPGSPNWNKLTPEEQQYILDHL